MMDDKGRIDIISEIDIVVSILILIAGIITLVFWKGFSNMTSSLASSIFFPDQYSWLEMAPWIVFFAGIISIIYGAERLIDNILKITVTKNQ